MPRGVSSVGNQPAKRSLRLRGRAPAEIPSISLISDEDEIENSRNPIVRIPMPIIVNNNGSDAGIEAVEQVKNETADDEEVENGNDQVQQQDQQFDEKDQGSSDFTEDDSSTSNHENQLEDSHKGSNYSDIDDISTGEMQSGNTDTMTTGATITEGHTLCRTLGSASIFGRGRMENEENRSFSQMDDVGPLVQEKTEPLTVEDVPERLYLQPPTISEMLTNPLNKLVNVDSKKWKNGLQGNNCSGKSSASSTYPSDSSEYTQSSKRMRVEEPQPGCSFAVDETNSPSGSNVTLSTVGDYEPGWTPCTNMEDCSHQKYSKAVSKILRRNIKPRTNAACNRSPRVPTKINNNKRKIRSAGNNSLGGVPDAKSSKRVRREDPQPGCSLALHQTNSAAVSNITLSTVGDYEDGWTPCTNINDCPHQKYSRAAVKGGRATKLRKARNSALKTTQGNVIERTRPQLSTGKVHPGTSRIGGIRDCESSRIPKAGNRSHLKSAPHSKVKTTSQDTVGKPRRVLCNTCGAPGHRNIVRDELKSKISKALLQFGL